MKRHSVPFEHVDVWVPNYTAGELNGSDKTCLLSFAGSVTTETEILFPGRGPSQKMDEVSQFNLNSFSDYSQKLSFDVGCGFAGHVFENGKPCWEILQNQQNSNRFECLGGAKQWGALQQLL